MCVCVFQHLYATYIAQGAPRTISCSSSIQNDIHYRLDPPYEELFDLAEEYVLTVLFDAWTQTLSIDLTTFDKVKKKV